MNNIKEKGPQRPSWTTRLWALTAAWRSLSSTEAASIELPYVGPEACSFVVVYPIVSGVDFAAAISAWQIGQDFSIRVYGRFNDYRVSALVSFVAGFEFTIHFASFDVLAAACVIEQRPLHPSPTASMSRFNSEVREILADYRAKLDRIWGHFGCRDRRSFEALAMWIIKNKHCTGGHANDLGQVFAAFIYGERDLARELLENFEDRWRQRAAEEAGDEAVLNIWNNVQAQVAAAQRIIK